MAAFRRCVIALAVLAVFAGLASAQSSVPINCTINSQSNTIQQESKNALVGDMTIVCTGGTLLADDSPVPRMTFVVALSTPLVTSRTQTTVGSGSTAQLISDALLTIDEPGTGGGLVPNFGPNQSPAFCATNQGPLGCAPATANGAGAIYKENITGIPVPSSTTFPATAAAANVFQGVVSANTVTFYGVPVLAPVSTGVARVFRITNIRTDATTANAGATVTASLSFSCTTTFNCATASSVISPTSGSATVATVQAGLSATATKSTPSSQTVCISPSATAPILIGSISFGEGFPSAFRPRQVGNASPGTSVSNTTTLQSLPGGNYTYSESGLVLTATQADAGLTQTGLADFGTRLKATFANVPANVRLFVSTGNIALNALVVPGGVGNNQSITFAELLQNTTAVTEFASDGASGPTVATGSVTATDGVTAKEVTLTSGAGEAVWEVTNTKGSASETLTFNIYVSYAANVPLTTGTGGSVASPTAVLSFAPTGTAPTGSNILPQYAVVNTTPNKVFDLTSCRTILLFPFLTNTAGFDTGIAIANTSTDPFTTSKQTGPCNLYFYGTGAPVTEPVATSSVATGTSNAFLVSSVAPGFSGYMIAVCNFQFAHGFVFLTQANFNGTMGYLPLVVPDPGTGARVATEVLEN
ncbi:MAG: hypothetical protein LAP40_14570 [Acidobacteriia bacterium]|nr:hypothetical protein [Terriglobia bacterium]